MSFPLKQSPRNIYFLKIHKTGSTTLYNIFARYAIKNNLRWTTYNKRPYEPGRRNKVNSFINSIFPKFKLNHSVKYNILADHSIYNIAMIEQILETPITHCTFIRHPYIHLRSYLNEILHWNSQSEDTVKHFLKLFHSSNPQEIDQNIFINPVAKALGFPQNITSPADVNFSNHFRIIKTRFYIGITDNFTASLLLMRRHYNLSWEDVIFVPLRKSRHSKGNGYPKPSDLRALCEVSVLDCFIYDSVKKEFSHSLIIAGPDFDLEMKEFEKVLVNVHTYCQVIYTKLAAKNLSDSLVWNDEPLHIEPNTWSSGFLLTPKQCALMRIEERALGSYFYFKQNWVKCKDAKVLKKCPIQDGRIKNLNCQKVCLLSGSSSEILDNILKEHGAYLWH